MSLLRTVARNLASMSAMRIGSAVMSFALFWYITMARNSEALGMYALLLGVFALLQQLPLLGLHLVAIREVAANPQAAAKVNATLGVLGMVTAGTLAVGCAVAGHWFYPEALHLPFILVALSLLPTAWTNVAEAILIGRQDMASVARVNLGESFARSVASGLLVVADQPIQSLFIVFLLGRVGAAAFYYRSGILPRWRAGEFCWNDLKRNLGQAPTFFVIMLLSAVLARFDVVYLSRTGSLSDVGVYAMAAKIYEAALMAPSVLTSVLYPVFASVSTTRPRLESTLRISVYWVSTLGLPCILVVVIAAEPLLTRIFGGALEGTVHVFVILIWATWLVALNQLHTAVLLACHGQKYDLFSLIISAFAFIVLLFVLTSSFGIAGVAMAVVLASAVQLIARYGFVRFRCQIRPGLGALWKPLLASIAMYAIADGTTFAGPVIQIAGGLVGYCLTLVLLRGVPRRDLAELLDIVKSRRRPAAQ